MAHGLSPFLGSGPVRGQSPVEWGDFPFICPSVRPFPPLGFPARPEAQPARPEAYGWLAGWASDLAVWALGMAGWASGLAGWPGGGDERTDKRTDVRTENLPIRQDFISAAAQKKASNHQIFLCPPFK